jgi:type IV secretion system protein VirB10
MPLTPHRPRRRATSVSHAALAVALAVTLAACDNGPAQQIDEPIGLDEQAVQRSQEELLFAINTKPIDGARLTANPKILFLESQPGRTVTSSARIINEGDVETTIESIIATTPSSDLVLGGDCAAGKVLEPGRSCDIDIRYKDTKGRSLDTGILITSDAKHTPQLSISMVIDISEPEPEPEPVENRRTADPGPSREEIARARAIARANDMRRGSGFGRLSEAGGFGAAPRFGMKTFDTGYDPNLFPSVDTTLPVDRSRILTVDRVVKAVIETPIFSVMCSQVVASVDRDVYAPTGRNVLIPAGTRFIGHCAQFVGDRLNIVWERFITPSGVSAKINANTADSMGRGGAPGYRDNRYFDKYGIPLMFSALSATMTGVLGDDDESQTNIETGVQTTTETAKSRAVKQFTEDLRSTGQRIVEDLQDVQSVLYVPGGTRIDIVLNEDIYFKSPQEVVRLGDLEYEIVSPNVTPKIRKAAPQSYGLVPAGDGRSPANRGQTVIIDGQSYRLVPSMVEEHGPDPRRSGYVTPQPTDQFAPPQPDVYQVGPQTGAQPGPQGLDLGPEATQGYDYGYGQPAAPNRY